MLAFWAMAVAAGMIAVAHFAAIGAREHLSTQGFCPAAFDGQHGLAVTGQQAVGVLLAIGRAVAAEDVSQF